VAAGDGVFNVAMGIWRNYLALPAANDAVVVVLLKSAGLPVEATLRDFTTLASLLASSADEADFTGYARKILTSGITLTQDDVNERVDGDLPDQEWDPAGGATNNTLGKILFCYDPDTTVPGDNTIIPLTYHNFTATTDGNPLQARVAAAGFVRSAAG
jgi:hypothetical protein